MLGERHHGFKLFFDEIKILPQKRRKEGRSRIEDNGEVKLGLTPERSGKVGKAHAALPPPSHSREHPRAAKTQKQPPASFHVVESRFVDHPSRLSVRLAFCSFTSEEESQCCRRRRRFKEARGGKALSGKLH